MKENQISFRTWAFPTFSNLNDRGITLVWKYQRNMKNNSFTSLNWGTGRLTKNNFTKGISSLAMVSQWQTIEIKGDFVKTQYNLSHGSFVYFTWENNLLSISNNLSSLWPEWNPISLHSWKPERNVIYRNASKI